MSILTFKPQPRFRKHQNKLASFTLIVVALAFVLVKTTFASNISLNNAQTVEYGQGVSQAVACSGGSNITITPAETFTNASGGGSFTFSGFTVSGVPASCYGYDLQINAFDDSNNSPLSLYNGSSTDVLVWDNSGTFYTASTVTGLSLTTNSTTSYTVTFTTPVANSSSTYKIGIQSSINSILNCSNGGTCTVGQKGPGGGTVVFATLSGFSCGATLASTCHYIEMAPNTWAGGSADPYWNNWAPNSNSVAGAQSSNVGAGYANSLAVYQANGSTSCNPSSTCTYAVQAALNYTNNGIRDWFLPSRYELNVMCDYINGDAEVATNTDAAQTCIVHGSSNASGVDAFKVNSVYWSSTERSPQTSNAYDQYLVSATSAGSDVKLNTLGSSYNGQYDNVRPIREF